MCPTSTPSPWQKQRQAGRGRRPQRRGGREQGLQGARGAQERDCRRRGVLDLHMSSYGMSPRAVFSCVALKRRTPGDLRRTACHDAAAGMQARLAPR
jgi:hypothetical protein